MIEKIRSVRERVRQRMLAAEQHAAENDLDSDIFQDDACWLATILADIDDAMFPNMPTSANLSLASDEPKHADPSYARRPLR